LILRWPPYACCLRLLAPGLRLYAVAVPMPPPIDFYVRGPLSRLEAGSAPSSLAWLLQLVADGVPLTNVFAPPIRAL